MLMDKQLTSSLTAVVHEVNSLIPCCAISVSSLEVTSLSSKCFFVIIYKQDSVLKNI